MYFSKNNYATQNPNKITLPDLTQNLKVATRPDTQKNGTQLSSTKQEIHCV